MATITISLGEKCKQVIRTTDSFKEKKTSDEISKIANQIAWDISRNNATLVTVKDI